MWTYSTFFKILVEKKHCYSTFCKIFEKTSTPQQIWLKIDAELRKQRPTKIVFQYRDEVNAFLEIAH